MKRNLLIIPLLLGAAMIISASCASSKSAEEKAAQNRLTQLQDSLAHIHALQALKDMKFVITADRISFGPRGNVFTNPRKETNFTYVVGNEGVVQFAFENGAMGFNGLGGITCKGTVSSPKLSYDKKGNAKLSYTIFGTGVNATVFVTLYNGSDDAQAVVSSNLHSGSLTIYGKVQPYDIR
ncbi:MAG: DUF4251 domain-containing protein [Muribaculaceae bacterium]